MPIRQRQDRNCWQADVLIAGKRKRKLFATENEAIAWETEQLQQQRAKPTGPAVDDRGETLTSFANEFQVILWGTGDQCRAAMRHVKEAVTIIGDVTLKRFNNTHVAKLTAAYLKQGNSPATINRKYSSLSRLCRRAVQLEKMPKMPIFERRKEPEGRKRFLTVEEEQRLFAELRAISEDEHDFAVFLVDSGCRVGEAVGLHKRQIDFNATLPDKDGKPVVVGSITLDKTKADHTRTIWMTPRVREILLRRCKATPTPFGHVNRWTLRTHWDKAKIKAGFGDDPNIVPHILRHTCASRIVKKSGQLAHAQFWLGHKSANTTNRYAHLTLNAMTPALDALKEFGAD